MQPMKSTPPVCVEAPVSGISPFLIPLRDRHSGSGREAQSWNRDKSRRLSVSCRKSAQEPDNVTGLVINAGIVAAILGPFDIGIHPNRGHSHVFGR